MPNPFMEQVEESSTRRKYALTPERKRAYLRGEVATLFPEDEPQVEPTAAPAHGPTPTEEGTWLGEVLRAGIEKTTPAMGIRLATGAGPYHPPEMSMTQKVGAEIIGFGADPATYIGFGAGGVAAKGAGRLALKTLGKETLEGLGKKGLAGRMGKKALTSMPGGAAALGTMTAAKYPFEAGLHGDYSLKEHAKATGKSALLGAGVGAAGTIPNRLLALGAEVGVFGPGGAALEGRKATAEDWIMAGGVIGGLRMSKAMRRAVSDVRSGASAEEVAQRAKEAFLGSTAPGLEATPTKGKLLPNVGPWPMLVGWL